MDLATLGIEVKAKGVKEATKDLAALDKEAAKSQKQADKLAAGWKNTGKAIGVSIAAGVGLAGLAMKKYFSNTVEAERVQAQLAARIKSTGMAARLSLGDLNKMAQALQFKTSFDDESIGEVQSLLLTFTKIGRETFPTATAAVLDLSTAMGTDLNSAALQVGKALNDPVKGITALSRAGIQFSADQRKLIKDLVKVGDTAGAQTLILRELEKQMGGSAVAARQTLGGALKALENSFNNLLEGDSGDKGIQGARVAIEGLNTTLNDPKIKQGFADMVAGLAAIATAAANAIPPLVELIRKQRESFGFSRKSFGNGLRAPEAADATAGLSAYRALFQGDLRGFAARQTRALQSAFGFGSVADFSDVSVSSGSLARSRNARGGSNRPETGAKGTVEVPDETKVTKAARAVRDLSEAHREAARALREQILATDEFDRKQIELEESQADWRRGLEDITASLQGPGAVALLEYTRNLEEARAAHIRGAMTAEDLVKWEKALADQFAVTSAAAGDYGNALGEVSAMEAGMDSVGYALENAFASMGDSANSAKDIIGDFFDSIYQDALRWLGMQARLALFGGGTDSNGAEWGSLIDLFSGGSGFGFASGGFTGAGNKGDVAGLVHKGEYVINADATKNLPRGYLDALNNGASAAITGNGIAQAPQIFQEIHVTGTISTRTAQQLAQESGRQTRQAMSRNG